MSNDDDQPPTSPPPSSSPAQPGILLRPRRESFDYGLLPPIPNLVSAPLTDLKATLLGRQISSSGVDAPLLADALGISADHATLIIDTLSSVTPGAETKSDEGFADVCDLVLFLYVQSYRRIAPKMSKDSSAFADVWPSNSAFDRCLSAMSPIQLVRSNSRRSMPSAIDEEIHQLSYLHKHMSNMLALLADPKEGKDNENLMLTLENFVHLGLFVQFYGRDNEGISLQQAAQFFEKTDIDMSGVAVPAVQVLEWLLEIIDSSLVHTSELASAKGNGQQNLIGDDDVNGDDRSKQSNLTMFEPPNPILIEGIDKTSFIKQGCDIKGNITKVLNCHDSVIYILEPLRYATIYGCSDSIIFLGAVGKVARVEHCERVQIVVAAKQVCVVNCRECILYLGTSKRPIILGDNHKLQLAPYNTFYSKLNEHMNKASLDVTINRWSEPIVLASNSAGVDNVQAETVTCLDPDLFRNYLIPNWLGEDSSDSTKANPFILPEIYAASLEKQHLMVNEIQQSIREAQLGEDRRRELIGAIHSHFRDWLYASGNVRRLYTST